MKNPAVQEPVPSGSLEQAQTRQEVMMAFLAANPTKLGLNVLEAARVSGLGRDSVYKAIESGALATIKSAKKNTVPIWNLLDWMFRGCPLTVAM
jgi:hypothetical protein